MSRKDELVQLENQEKSLQSDCQHLDKQIESLKSDIQTVETQKAKALFAASSAESMAEASARTLRELMEKESSLKTRMEILDNDAARLPTEISIAKGAKRIDACYEPQPNGDTFVLLSLRLKKAEPEKPARDMSYPDAEPACLTIPTDTELPPISPEPIQWAFSGNRRGDVVVVDESHLSVTEPPVFLVGDLHGDVLSLRAILRKAFSDSSKSRIVFLGDLFDRGDKSIETARLFLWAAKTHPGQILWLRGNHDEALGFDAASGEFNSSVEPHEFADWLNAHQEAKQEGLNLVEIVKTLPIAAALGSVWISHGGVLHEDVIGDFAGFESLTGPMKTDFVWSRMKDTPSKMPNRSHKGAEVGYKQAVGFVDKLKAVEQLPIRHIVCAHQHEHKDGYGYLPFSKCFGKGDVTCQCICSFRDSEWDFLPTVLKLTSNGVPRPIQIVPDKES